MANEAILCIDQGTTNSKAILLNQKGQIVAQGSSPLNISYPKPGWVEQSAEEIWSSVVDAVCRCVEQSPTTQIIAIGISNQRESVVSWDAQSSQPLAPAITWQCRRTAAETERLKLEGHEAQVLTLTGLPLDPLFPASKIRWLMDNTNGKKRNIGTVDSWLIWNLTGGRCFLSDRSNASRTQLLNVKTGNWDESLCALFGVDSNLLPEVTNSQHTFGHTRNVPGISDGIPIMSAMGDSHAALFGHGAFQPGAAKVTFGTGSSVMMIANAFQVPGDGMTSTIAWSIKDEITYALEGNILVSASLFPWTATLLGLNGNVDKLMELAESVEHANGVTLVPALVGLGAPHWNPEARGIIAGLSFSSTPGHIAHAAALSMSLQVVDVFAAMHKQSALPPGQVNVDGGPTRNRFLMQSLANLLSQPVNISKDPELSAMGAGMLAGLEIGFWSSRDEVAELHRERVTIESLLPESDRAVVLEGWNDAVLKCQHA